MYISSALFLLPFIFGVALTSEETALFKALFHHYGPAERATRGVEHNTDRLNTTFGLTVINIVSMDTVNGIATLTAWTPNFWNDRRLRWDPSAYGGVTNMRIPNHVVWMPDTMLYNRLSATVEEYTDAKVVVDSNGDLVYVPPVTIEAPCLKDPTVQERWQCSLKFGSWTYDGNQFDIDFNEGKKQINVDDFKVMENGWKIIAQEATRNVRQYPCCPEPYVDLTFPFQVSK